MGKISKKALRLMRLRNLRKGRSRGIGKPAVIKAVSYQSGRRSKSRRADAQRSALRPGKRRAKSRKKYWETRHNRSDLKGRLFH